MKVEHIEEKPGVVRLTSRIEGLLTVDRCIEEATKLLRGTENLRDGGSVDFGDNILLAQETRVHTVIFSINGKEIEVNVNNIREIRNRLLLKKQDLKENKHAQHAQAIEEAVAENWGDISIELKQ